MTTATCTPRLGDLLIERGVLTEDQVSDILEKQTRRSLPFGAMAERLYGVEPKVVEEVWAEQYAIVHHLPDLENEKIDLDEIDRLNRRQAWQMGIVPMREEDGFLIVATTVKSLPRAVNFCRSKFELPVIFKIVEAECLEEALEEYYSWPAMSLAMEIRVKLLARAAAERTA